MLNNSDRIKVCVYLGDPFQSELCGTTAEFRRGCSGPQCRAAYAKHRVALKKRPQPKRRVFTYPHGEYECHTVDGCQCAHCLTAFRLFTVWRDAEDLVFASEPGRIPTWKLSSLRGRRNRGHGSPGAYAKNCRCAVCKLGSAFARAQTRLRTLPQAERTRKLLAYRLRIGALNDERDAKVDAYLNEHGKPGLAEIQRCQDAAAEAEFAQDAL